MIINIIDIQKIILLLFPIALITGPFIPEIIILSSLILYFFLTPNKEIYDDFNNKIFLFLAIFSLYIFIVGIISLASTKSLLTSIFFIRFPLFSIIVFKFIKNDNLFKQRYLYILLSIFIFFVIDSSVQSIFDKNIFGFKLIAGRVSSLFGDELILGSYITKMSPILFGLLFCFKDKLNKIYFLIIPLSLLVVILSGERSSFITLSILILLITIFTKFYKNYFISLFIILCLFLSLNSKAVQDRFVNDIKKKFVIYDNYLIPYEYAGFAISSFEQFKKSPIIGNGVRSFRINCKETLLDFKLPTQYQDILMQNHYKMIENIIKNGKCSTHPHNIFFEFIAELGLLGLFFIFYKFIYIFKRLIKIIFYDKKILNSQTISNLIFIISPFLIIYPFLPSGSFFNNWNLSVYFLNIAFFMYGISQVRK